MKNAYARIVVSASTIVTLAAVVGAPSKWL